LVLGLLWLLGWLGWGTVRYLKKTGALGRD
jgi:hypothetical protein